MLTERASGLLLHPTSIPTRFGIGDLGPRAYEFVDWLGAAGQRYWQVLPLCPADAGGSPYQSASSFAGNPLLISPELLARDGLLTDSELAAAELPDVESALRVDFALANDRKMRLLELAIERFYTLLEESLKPVKKRRPTKPTLASKQRRLDQKRMLSKKKNNRKEMGL